MRPRSSKLLGWRRVANAIWRAPNDPQMLGMMELDATAVLAFIEAQRARGLRVTETHLVGRATALAIRELPDLNVRLRFGRQVPHPTVDIFIITAVGGGRDLSGVNVRRADEKSAVQVADEVNRSARSLRAGTDPGFSRSKRLMERLPFFVLRPLLRFLIWLAGDLGVNIRPLGLAARPFGSAMVSSVGMLGLPLGYSPLVWMYRVPVLLLVGEITRKAVVVGDRVEIRPVMPVTATLDHRYVDGWHVSRMLRTFRAYLADPQAHEPATPDGPTPVVPATRREQPGAEATGGPGA